jgi:hypothetical protein
MVLRYAPFFACTLLTASVFAQGRIIDNRSQATGWFLPVVCNITANGGNTDSLTISVYKDNALVATLTPASGKGTCELELDLDNTYSILIKKPGYREKLITVDTYLPEHEVKYKKYLCNVNLEPMDRFAHSDPFYLDFPSSIVRWDEGDKEFKHNDEYLASMQLKMALAQLETR